MPGFTKVSSTYCAHVARRCSVERQVTAFGADDELLARDAVLVCECLQGLSDGAFASLKTIVRSAVDDVHAELNSANDRARVVRIGGFVGVAEIRADADRRKDETLLLAKWTIGETIAITCSAFRCGAVGGHV